METKFRTKVFGFSDILGEGWKIYKLGITKFILIALVVYLPISIFLYFFPMENILAQGETSAGALLLSCVYPFVQIGIALVVYIAVAYLVEEIVQGRRTSWTAVLRYTFSRLPMVLIVDLIVGVIVAFGMLLLIIPGIIIGIYLVFTPAIVALRKIGFQAFQYSIDLVKGQWWRVFGISIGIGFIAAAFNLLLSWVIRTSAPYIGFGTILINLVSYLVTVLFSIFPVAFFLNQDYLKHPIESEPGSIEPQTAVGQETGDQETTDKIGPQQAKMDIQVEGKAKSQASKRSATISFIVAILLNVLFALLIKWATSADLLLCLPVSAAIIGLAAGAGALLAKIFSRNPWRGATIGIWIGAVASIAVLIGGVFAAGS